MGVVFARVTQPCQPSPVPRPDRPAHRPFRGLLSVHSRCGLHTRTVTVCRDRYPKASDTSSPPCLLRSLPAGAVAGSGLHPLEKRRLVTAHAERGQSTLFPECLDDWIDKDNAVRVIDVFVDELDLSEVGFGGVDPKATGRPSYHPSILLKL